jgi:hypothetical protein
MPIPQTFRDNEIKRMTDCISGGMAENSLGTGIPKADDAIAIGRNDCIGARMQK